MRNRKYEFICLSLLFIIAFCYQWRYLGKNYTKTLLPNVSEQDNTKAIRIGTYNVKLLNHGEAVEDAIKEIKTMDLDVLHIQEVDQYTWRSHHIDMVQTLAEQCGYDYYYFFPSMWIGKGHYGIGILSRYPIVQVSSSQLPNDFIAEPRLLVCADILIGGNRYHFYNTHLSYRDRDMRVRQIDYIKKNVEKENSILMGDFNTFYIEEMFSLPDMEAVNTPQNTYITFRDFGFPDNIYYSSSLHVQHPQTLRSSFSDHNALICTLLLS